MIKRVIETLGEIERAASSNGWQQGRELLCDFITRVTTLNYANDQNGAALEYYKGIVAKHREVSEENGRVDEEPVEDYMVRVWHSLGVAQRFAEDMQEKLKTKDATIKSLRDDRALMDEWHGVSMENGRIPDELMTDYMVRVWDSLQVAQRLAEDMKAKLQAEEGRYSKLLSETTETLLGSAARIDSLEKQLGEVRKCARKHGWNEVYGWTNEASLCDFLKTALDVSQPGITALQAQVEDLKAGEAESKAAAEEYGVLPDETHAQFIKRVLGDLATAKEEARRERERANRINSESEENMKKLWKCANDLGRADYETLWSFMDRQAAEIAKLNSTHSDDIARIDGLSARMAAIAAEASECGAEEGESVIDFLKRQDAEIEKEGTRAFEAGEALKMWKQDAQDKGQELLKVRAWHEEKLQRIRELEAERVSLMAAGNDSVMEYAYKVADGIGRMEDETLFEFMTRTHDELQSVKNDRAKAKKEMDAEFTRLLAVAKTNDSYTKEANDISKANGRTDGESLGWFIDRICAESKRKDQTVARLQKVLTAIHGAAKAGGLKQGEKIGAFIERLNAELYKVRCDAASESLKMGNANKQIQRSYEESRLRSAEELKTARAESLRARTELSEIAKIVNPESENGPVIDFVTRLGNSNTFLRKALDEANKKYDQSHKLHVWAVKEQNSAQEEVRKLSAELAKETRRLREYEDDYAQIYSLAAAAGMQGNESVKQCLERKLAELSTITADRDRIRAELAAILAEANKSGRCSGDPVALIRQGQNDLDARIAAEREAEDIKKRWRALN